MAFIVKLGTGWVNLDTVAAATTQEGTGALGLRFAGSTEFAYLDAQDSAIMREVLDTAAINDHEARGGARPVAAETPPPAGPGHDTAVIDAADPVRGRRFDRSRPARGYNRDE